jgi:anti-sigma B factor antagonist
MKLKSRVEGDVGVIEISGSLSGGPEAEEYHQAVKQHVSEGRTKVLVDLGRVKHINSSGLGILMASVATLGQAGGTLKLMRPGKRVSSLLMVTRLIQIFETYDDESSALASFASS